MLPSARVPLPFFTLRMPEVHGAVFLDAGSSWLEGQRAEGLWGSYGASLRAPIVSSLVLRIDAGRRFRIGDPPSVLLGRGRGFDQPFIDFFFLYGPRSEALVE
jgi:hypothetical protein